MDRKNLLRQRIRAAADIHAHLSAPGKLARIGQLPHGAWNEATRSWARLELAVTHGWQAAGDRILANTHYVLRQLLRETEELYRALPATTGLPNVVPTRDILADLGALDDEFEKSELHLREHTVSVWTSSVVLEGVDLGSFRIELDWRKIGYQRAYEVIAEEPCAAEDNTDITHPHVQSQILCEGEGSAAIRAALQEGRLLDFFTLARQVLLTYNPSSAYIPLETWDGQVCSDCGERVSRDDTSSCDRCNDAVCGDCTRYCQRCETVLCNSCSECCAGCSEDFCASCLSVAGSGRPKCESCLEPGESDDDISDDAVEPSESAERAPAPDSDETLGAYSPVHALCLGEAIVSA